MGVGGGGVPVRRPRTGAPPASMNLTFDLSLYVTLISAILTAELIKVIVGLATRPGSQGAMGTRAHAARGRPASDG
ncbi:MAG: hypothetical protein JO356_09125 [Acidobacteria bacterium]|nr:hypothetical protein [Acidobacteriota bacterium]